MIAARRNLNHIYILIEVVQFVLDIAYSRSMEGNNITFTYIWLKVNKINLKLELNLQQHLDVFKRTIIYIIQKETKKI